MQASYSIGAYLRSANLEGRSYKRMIENLVRQDEMQVVVTKIHI